MAVTTDQPAPYAPASAILDLIDRHRNKGLPQIVDADVLLRAGVSDSLVPRTLQALRTLDLLTNEGQPSEVFETLRLAPTAEYQAKLTEWLNRTYADALVFVDPATCDEIAVRDAFRKYVPTGQQSRMVSLFIGLFTAAGVMQPRSKQPSATKSRVPASHGGPLPKPRLKPKFLEQRNSANHSAKFHSPGDVPPAIAGLLATLPAEGGIWSQARRDQFLAAMGAILDYTFVIGEPPAFEPETERD